MTAAGGDRRTTLERLAVPLVIYEEWSNRPSARKWFPVAFAAYATLNFIVGVIGWSSQAPVYWPLRMLLAEFGVPLMVLVGSGLSKAVVWSDTAVSRWFE